MVDVGVRFLGVWRIRFVGRLRIMFPHPLFVASRQEDRNINERNDTRATDRISDIIIDMRRV